MKMKKKFLIITVICVMCMCIGFRVKVHAGNEEYENYNFVEEYGKINFIVKEKYYSIGALLGNSIEQINNGGRVLKLSSNSYFKAGRNGILYGNRYDIKNEIEISKLQGVRNLNIFSKGNKKILYFTVDNKIMRIDLSTGEYEDVYEFSSDSYVEKMHLVNNKYLIILCDSAVYRYEISNYRMEFENYDSRYNVVDFIPTGYDTTFDEDRVVVITKDSIVADTDLKNTLSGLHPFARDYEITNVYAEDDYIYIDTYMPEKWPNDEEYRSFRVKIEDLFSIRVSTTSSASIFEQI